MSTVTLNQIETRALEVLRASGLNVPSFDVRQKPTEVITPAVSAWIRELVIEDGPETREQVVVLSFFVLFKHLRSAEDRQHGIYEIVQGILLALMEKDLDLDIEGLVPLGASEVPLGELWSGGYLMYEVRFRTSFALALEDEAASGLLTVGLSYYLQDPSDDGEADASDVVELNQ